MKEYYVHTIHPMEASSSLGLNELARHGFRFVGVIPFIPGVTPPHTLVVMEREVMDTVGITRGIDGSDDAKRVSVAEYLDIEAGYTRSIATPEAQAAAFSAAADSLRTVAVGTNSSGLGSQTPPVAADAPEPRSDGGFTMTRGMVARQRIDEWLAWAGLQLADLIRITVAGAGGGAGPTNSSGPASAEASQPTPPPTWGGK